MKIRWPWAKNSENEDIGSIEAMLEGIYQPVDARPAFVDELRGKLVGVKGPIGVASRSTLELILMIGGAIIGIVLFVFGAIRAVIALLAGIRLIGGKMKTKQKSKDGMQSSSS